MARNRKSQSPAIRFVPALKAILLCTLLGASSVGYVLQKNKIFELGNQIQNLESRLETLKRDNLLLQSRLAELLSPTKLEQAIHHYNLDLTLPQPNQMIWLSEPTLNNNTNDVPPLLVWGNGVSRPVMQ